MTVMLQKLERVHVGFLRHVTEMKDRRLGDNYWRKEEAYRVILEVGTKPLWGYINKRRTTVSEWVSLRPTFEVCSNNTEYEGGGRLREPWWK